MAHLWIDETIDEAKAPWRAWPLTGRAYWLSPGKLPCRLDDAGTGQVRTPDAMIVRRDRGEWVLLAAVGSAVTINGRPLPLGTRVLRDRDLVVVGGPSGERLRCFYSTERLAEVEPFSETSEVRCPRCKQPIAFGTQAVACPGCRVYHHQTEELPCWTYAPRCALCDQPTELTEQTGYRWTPEQL